MAGLTTPHGDSEMMQSALGTDTIAVCQRLFAVARDAAHGWLVAADAIDDLAISDEMRRLAGSREQFAAQLTNVIMGRGGQVEVTHTGKGRLLTWWLEARSDHHDVILKVCRRGSAAALKEYEEALAATVDDPPVHEMLVGQTNELRRTAEWLETLH